MSVFTTAAWTSSSMGSIAATFARAAGLCADGAAARTPRKPTLRLKNLGRVASGFLGLDRTFLRNGGSTNTASTVSVASYAHRMPLSAPPNNRYVQPPLWALGNGNCITTVPETTLTDVFRADIQSFPPGDSRVDRCDPSTHFRLSRVSWWYGSRGAAGSWRSFRSGSVCRF